MWFWLSVLSSWYLCFKVQQALKNTRARGLETGDQSPYTSCCKPESTATTTRTTSIPWRRCGARKAPVWFTSQHSWSFKGAKCSYFAQFRSGALNWDQDLFHGSSTSSLYQSSCQYHKLSQEEREGSQNFCCANKEVQSPSGSVPVLKMPGRKDTCHWPQAVLWQLVLPENVRRILRGMESASNWKKL